jgi:hypothetical protein
VDRQDAFDLAGACVVSFDPRPAEALRPVLAELFERTDTPTTHLVPHVASGEPVTAYLLSPPALIAVTAEPEPLTVTAGLLRLDEVIVTRTAHDLKPMQGGVWWQVTWRFAVGNQVVELTGEEGVPHAADNVAEFAAAVGKAAGWPIAEPSK